MIRSWTVRLLALAAGLGASLTGPAVALAHGHAHHEAAEHAAHHVSSVLYETDHPAVVADDHDQDHGHPRLEPSAFTRVVKVIPTAVASEPVTIALAGVAFRETRDAPEPNESPPDRPGVSPVHSRAPPTL